MPILPFGYFHLCHNFQETPHKRAKIVHCTAMAQARANLGRAANVTKSSPCVVSSTLFWNFQRGAAGGRAHFHRKNHKLYKHNL
jgi:hypothetical protein